MLNKLFKTKQYWQQTWKVFELEQTFNWKVFKLGKTLASIWTSNKLGKCLDQEKDQKVFGLAKR